MTAYVLNLFDLLCTLCALEMGAKELNPLMQCVPVMVFYKTVIVGLLLWWLIRVEAIWAVRVCTVFYAILAIYYVVGMTMILT